VKILVIGKSAREQAFIEKISESNKSEKIYCIPGNPAIAQFAECVNIPIEDLTSMVEFAKEYEIDLTIALDEYVIQNGIANIFKQENLKIFAPTQEAAQIATSRSFAKKFLYKNKIPTPKYAIFDKENSALDYLGKAEFPLMVKYDHLAHQDSFLCTSLIKARNIISNVFNEVEKKVVIEEYLEGEIITFSILTDGYNVIPLPYTKIYKRTLNGDGGAFTKGVGAYTPTNKISEDTEQKIAKEIIFPLLDVMQAHYMPYEGFLSVQLIILPNNEVKVLEFLPTISIPEATCTLQLIENDLLEIIYAATEGALEDYQGNIIISEDTCVSVALMSGSYPINPKTNSPVEGIEDLDDDNINLYYNETGMNEYYEVVTTGGRPFFMTSRASTLNKATENLYNNIGTINFNGKNYRTDIGKLNIYKGY